MRVTIAVTSLLFVSLMTASPIEVQNAFKGICPNFDVRCVKDGDWRNPIGRIGPKPFCREGVRCNQCEQSKNTRECNRTFKECEGQCEAYGPIPF